MENMSKAAMMKDPKKTVDKQMKDLFDEFKKIPSEVELFSETNPRLFRIWDINQKFLFLLNNMLIAAPLHSNSPEELMAVIPNRGIKQTEEDAYPVFMGLADGATVLSCVDTGGQPQLKIVKEIIMKLYRKNEELKSFTFFMRAAGNKWTCSFESAAFPGWFISTSSEPNKPIGLSHEGGTEITMFYFEKSN